MASVDVTMLFCTRFGLSDRVDPTFRRKWRWYDESALDGIPHRFISDATDPCGPVRPVVPRIALEIWRGGYDAVLVQGYSTVNEFLAMAAARTRRCAVLFRGETVMRSGTRVVRRSMQRLAVALLLRLVDVFLAIGSRSAEFYRHHGVDESRMEFSPYTVDNAWFLRRAREQAPHRAAVRRALAVPADVPILLYVSKMTARKRPADVLAAVRRLQSSAALVFVGDGPERPALEAQAARDNLQNVRFVGFQKQADLPKFYAAADVFVLPSAFEPWGLVVNEAMCFGLPVVTTMGVSAAADLVVDGHNGFVCPVGDITALRERLEHLVACPEVRRAMGERSRQHIMGWNHRLSVDGIARALAKRPGGG